MKVVIFVGLAGSATGKFNGKIDKVIIIQK
jgi:hypothetical protein